MEYGSFRTDAIDGGLPTPAKIPGVFNGGNVASFLEQYDLATAGLVLTAGTAYAIAKIPAGHALLDIDVQSSVSLTTTQLEFGTEADPNAYGTAKAYGTTANAKVNYTLAAMKGHVFTEDTLLIMTSSVADLPGAGIVNVEVRTAARG